MVRLCHDCGCGLTRIEVECCRVCLGRRMLIGMGTPSEERRKAQVKEEA